MTPEQERHLTKVKAEFGFAVDAKYRAGQAQHGGDLWRKKGIIKMLKEEAIDTWVYACTLEQQIEESGVELGTEVDG
jgi:hypothetical protein